MSTGGKDHEHRFDPVSGWCWYCNLREDGRLVSKGGDVWQSGRGYSAAELDTIRRRLQEQNA